MDSIPAIFGLTQIPFIVFTANVFALMGLRQLYVSLLGNLLDRLVFLGLGLAAVLGFIGVKLILTAMHENALSFLNGGEPFDVPVIFELDQPCGDRRHTDGHCGGKSVARALRGHRGRTG